ncbi:uncharacterized protein METZ01_LOCUS76840, partial [marine metagenome]
MNSADGIKPPACLLRISCSNYNHFFIQLAVELSLPAVMLKKVVAMVLVFECRKNLTEQMKKT